MIYIAGFRPVRATLRPCLKHDKIKHSMPAQTALSGSLIVTVVSVRCVWFLSQGNTVSIVLCTALYQGNEDFSSPSKEKSATVFFHSPGRDYRKKNSFIPMFLILLYFIIFIFWRALTHLNALKNTALIHYLDYIILAWPRIRLPIINSDNKHVFQRVRGSGPTKSVTL